MKTLIASIAVALVVAAPASAAVTLTRGEARAAARLSAQASLGSLTYRSTGSAPVRVADCRVSKRRGRCFVTVSGLQKCSYTAHVLELNSGDVMVWGTGIRCGQ